MSNYNESKKYLIDSLISKIETFNTTVIVNEDFQDLIDNLKKVIYGDSTKLLQYAISEIEHRDRVIENSEIENKYLSEQNTKNQEYIKNLEKNISELKKKNIEALSISYKNEKTMNQIIDEFRRSR